MNHLHVFSAIYLIIASGCPTMGFYVLQLNPKSLINRLFFFICLGLTIWSLGFSLTIIAPNETNAELWSKFYSLGVNSFYSLLVHFILAIAGFTKIIKKKWFLALLYLPAIACVYIFSFSPGMGRLIYEFEFTARGWVRTGTNTVFDNIFHVYFLSSTVSCFVLLFIWKARNEDRIIKKQANLILYSFFIAFGIGAFTDIGNAIFTNLPIPMMAPILFLLPISAFLYSINKFHFMKPAENNDLEIILSEEHRKTVFRIASYGLIFSGIILFLIQNFWWKLDNPLLTIVTSSMLVIIGLALNFVQKIKNGFQFLEMFLIFISIITTPLIMLNTSSFGGMSLWAFPVVLIFCAMVFNSRNMLMATTVPAFFSQIYLLVIHPQKTVLLDWRSYSSRIMILLFVAGIAYYVHMIYLKRLKENALQASTQTLISDIVRSFSLVDQDDTTSRLKELLGKLVKYFNADIAIMDKVTNDTADIIDILQYTTAGTELPAEKIFEISEYWDRYIAENPELRSTIPWEGYNTANKPLIPQENNCLFIPVYGRQNRLLTYIYIEKAAPGADWVDDQLATVPVISRIVSDTLAQLSYEKRVRYMAYYDELTGLPNRQLFKDRIEQAIQLARRNNMTVGLVFMDLDSFKFVNDTMGHEQGDLLLKDISQKLKDKLRKTDTVARFGGDEFLVLINNIANIEDIKDVAEKIISIFRDAFTLNGQEIFITASAGISVFPIDGEDVDTLIKHADMAMYTAKDKGKNQFAFCSDNMKESVKYRVMLSNSLNRALERNELTLFYQPQVDLVTEKITGFEALLRWIHPDLGMIPPLEFISLAEQTGLINPIGAWVLDSACAQLVNWDRMGYDKLRMAVNLSVVQLRNPDFLQLLKDTLARHSIDVSRFELEITESVAASEPEYIINVLNRLKSIGVNISIDDFGIEYSSLNRLKMLPVDTLKIDMQFVRGIDLNPKDKAISGVIMKLAKSLNLKIVAEGVETVTQLDFLKAGDCDEVQGYYYYKPMPSRDLEAILAKTL